MYKHILVPTDGSKLSQKAVKAAADLAATTGARMTALYVMPEYIPPIYGEASLYITQVSPANFRKSMEKGAAAALAMVAKQAEAAGVKYAGVKSTGAQPWTVIVNAARSKKCDLIVMASHGRSGMSGLLLGSETTKVLTHTKVPVLVVR